jgi:hypothetical protein
MITRHRLIWVQALIVLGLCACEADIPQGRFACQSLAECPSDWYCVQGFCYATLLGACVPTSCEGYAAECGTHPDGCGGVTDDCGRCTSPDKPYCSGTACSSTPCVPITSCPAGACGFISNNCGGVIECPSCCTPTTCQEQGVRCGTIDNGCGQTLDCEAETGGCGVGGHCEGVECVCEETEEEENDESYEKATDLDGELPQVYERFNLHNASDVDWFKFELDDTAADVNLSGRIQVALHNIPIPSNYELSIGMVCEINASKSECVVAAGEPPKFCRNPAAGSQNESVFLNYSCTGKKTVYIQVVAITWAQTCATYKLLLNHEPVTLQ